MIRCSAARLRLLALSRQLSSSAPQWTRFEAGGELPSTRSSHGVSILGDTLLVFGGEHTARTPIDSAIHALDLGNSSAKWSVLKVRGGIFPPPRVAHAQALVGDDLYIFGGRQGIAMDEVALDDLWRYSVTGQSWELVSAANPPAARSFHKMAAVGTTLYVFGGCGIEGRLADLHAFDTIAQSWSVLPSAESITGRGGAGFAASGDGRSLFVVGGFAGRETNDVHRYDIASESWTQVLPDGNDLVTPFSVSCGGSVKSGGGHELLCFFGGEVGPSAKGHEGAGGFSSTILSLDANTGAFVAEASSEDRNSPSARGWSSAAVWGGTRLVVFGGLSGNDERPERLDDLWIWGS